MRILPALVIILVALSGCGDSSVDADAADSEPDAAVDAPMDAAAPDAGPCGDKFVFTGAYVDWDSTDAAFRGVASAELREDADPGNTATTAPNGRATLCLRTDSVSLIHFEHPDYIDLRYAADPRIDALGAFEIKGLTPERKAELHAGDFDQAPSPGAAMVQVAVVLDAEKAPALGVKVEIGTAHGGAYTNDGTGTYVAGDTVISDPYIIFPNVLVNEGMIELQVTPPEGVSCLVPPHVFIQDGGMGAATIACTRE
jgi:hypothetical protein